jgi:PIN domain nuclease of toxin-antitoxin system
MNFLLDTAPLLWSLTRPEALSSKAREAIEDPENSIFYSILNLWEIQIKYQIGKLPLKAPPEKIFPNKLPAYAFERLNLEETAVYCLQSLPMIHNDPFDRLLIAQALTQHCTLITSDHNIQKYPLPLLWE